MRLPIIGNLGLLTLVVVGLAAVLPARAALIDSYTTDIGSVSSEYLGESFTTPGGGPWDDITFNFYSSGNPLAVGTAYIFSSPYAGAPNGLSSATDFATSTGITADEYVFAPSLTLQPGTTYYLYSDTAMTADDDGGNASDPAVSFVAASASSSFANLSVLKLGPPPVTVNADLDYSLQGSVVSSAPEPATFGLALGGILLFLAGKRKQSEFSK